MTYQRLRLASGLVALAALLGSPAAALAGAHEGAQASDGFQIGDLALNIYGFVMADTIYDFKRVDPDWNDTLRVSTIPTVSSKPPKRGG